MSALSFAKGNRPLRHNRNMSMFSFVGTPGVAYEMNGRYFFLDCFSLNGRDLIAGINYQPVERTQGRIARYKQGTGLQTSTTYPSGETGWTTHVSEASFFSGIVPAYSAGLLGCMKLGSTYHFLVLVAQNNNIEASPWISIIRHVSTADFATWSSVTSITDNLASSRYSMLGASGFPTGRLYKVGTNLLLPLTFNGDFSNTSMLTSTNGTSWTRRTRNSYTSLLQAYEGSRMFDIEASSSPLQSAYTDDGVTWTDFTLSNTFNTVGNGIFLEGRFLMYAQTGSSWGLWESPDPATVPFTLSPISTAVMFGINSPMSLLATPAGLVNLHRIAGGTIRYFV